MRVAPGAPGDRRWYRRVDLPIVFITVAGAVHVYRGAVVDAVVFLGLAAALTVDRLRAGRTAPGPGDPPGPVAITSGGPATGGPGGPGSGRPVAVRSRLVRLVRLVLVGAGAAMLGSVVGGVPRYGSLTMIILGALGLVTLALIWPTPPAGRPGPAAGRWSTGWALVWLGVAVAGALWELAAFLDQPSPDVGNERHPTLSTLLDPVLADRPARMIALTVWAAIGWTLIRRLRGHVRAPAVADHGSVAHPAADTPGTTPAAARKPAR